MSPSSHRERVQNSDEAPVRPARGMEKGFSALASIGTRNGISVFIERHAPVLFVAPGGLILGLVIVGPILLNVVYSFLDWHLLSGTSTFIGLQNYQEVLFTSEVWLSFRRTLIWAISSVAIQLLLGMMAALCLQQIRYGRKLFRTLLIVPWAFPPISTVFIWRWMLDAVHGIVNYALLSCGIVSRAVPWFGTKQTAMFSLVAMNSWYGFPFMAMAISAGLQAIPRDYYEVGAIEGASGWKQFWQVTVPSLREILAIIVVLRFIWVFNNFDFIFMTTGGGPGTATQTLPIYAYQIGWVRYAMGKSAAVTVVMTAIMMTLGLIYMRALGARRGEA